MKNRRKKHINKNDLKRSENSLSIVLNSLPQAHTILNLLLTITFKMQIKSINQSITSGVPNRIS